MPESPVPETVPSADELMLVITREFQVPITAVWSALTDPEQAPAWWGPRGFHTPRESIDAAVHALAAHPAVRA